MNVHQVLSGAGPHDAVTTQALAFRTRFGAWGWGGRDVAAAIDPRVGDAIKPLRSLDPAPGDVLLVHYSAYAPRLRAVLERPNPTLLLSHNITPARWFWDWEPYTAVQCALGRRQLPEFAERADVCAGVSAFNAGELGSDVVVPILFDPSRLGEAGPPDPPGPPTVLFVGRLTPHKRQDELIRAVGQLRRRGVPDARLQLVGEPITPAYREALEALAAAVAPGAVTIESGLSGEELAQRFRSAHVLGVLSEHEGFCIPLLEAFHFGLPVVARPPGGVPEVAGDAALLVEDRDPGVVAEVLRLALTDGELRAELRERGRARLAAYAPARAEDALREAVLTARAARSGPSPASSVAAR